MIRIIRTMSRWSNEGKEQGLKEKYDKSDKRDERNIQVSFSHSFREYYFESYTSPCLKLILVRDVTYYFDQMDFI